MAITEEVFIKRVVDCVIVAKTQESLNADAIVHRIVDLGVDPQDAAKVINAITAGFKAGVSAVVTQGMSAESSTSGANAFYDEAFCRGKTAMRFTTPGWVLAKRVALLLVVVGVLAVIISLLK